MNASSPREDVTPTTFANTTDGVRRRTVATVYSRNASADVVVLSHAYELYSVQWRLPSGEGELQPLKLLVTFGDASYYSNEVTIDYERAVLDRVVTMQCVTVVSVIPHNPYLQTFESSC